MGYKEKYNKLVEAIKELQESNPSDEGLQNWVNDNVPELKWDDDENIRKELIAFLRSYDPFLTQKFIVWLEKQGEQKQETNYPKFDYDDILALQCCMKNAEKVTEDKELHEKLKSLHSRLHDAYRIEKQSIRPRYNIGDVICDKSCTTLNKDAQPNMEIVDIKNGMYICDKGSFPVSQQDEYELVSRKIDTKLNDDPVSNELREASFAHARKEIKNPTCPDNEEFELAYAFEEGAKWEAAQKSIRSKEDKKVFDEVNSFLEDLKKLK